MNNAITPIEKLLMAEIWEKLDCLTSSRKAMKKVVETNKTLSY